MTKNSIKKLVHNYKIALLDNNIPITAIYLFGSYSRNQQREGSDIDLCVVSSSFGKNDFQEMVKVNQIAKKIAFEIEAFPVSEKEFKAQINPFATEALKANQKLV